MKTIVVHLKLDTLRCELLIDEKPQEGPLSFEITLADNIKTPLPDANGMVRYEPGPRRVTVWLDGQVVFTTLDAPTAVQRKGNDMSFTWQVDD
jgi:hypothetical protein